jgi:hypothetical protein
MASPNEKGNVTENLLAGFVANFTTIVNLASFTVNKSMGNVIGNKACGTPDVMITVKPKIAATST